MQRVARVESLWRYPVKSMGGESLERVELGQYGLAHDRLIAFESADAPVGKPLMTGEQRTAALQCRARFLDPGAPASRGGVVPEVEVEVRAAGRFALDDPALIEALTEGLTGSRAMCLRVYERPAMDCRPVSLLSVQTLRQLAGEVGFALDPSRFRANILLDLEGSEGFGEDQWVGRTIAIGDHATLLVKERDPRCRVITLDPRTGERAPELIAHVARAHENRVGIYATPVGLGSIAVGDAVSLLD